MKKLRIYVDTSVFGGCLDDEFQVESQRLFDEIKSGRFTLIISATTERELEQAPDAVRRVLQSLDPTAVELVPLSGEIQALRDAYVTAGVVGRSSLRDAEHMACASVAGADMAISWNFKHIVHYDKIAGYNAVNLVHGYRPLQIFSPKEVVES